MFAPNPDTLPDFPNKELILKVLDLLKREKRADEHFNKSVYINKVIDDDTLEVIFVGFEVGGSYCYNWESIYPPRYANVIERVFAKTAKYTRRSSGGFGSDNYHFTVTLKSKKELTTYIDSFELAQKGLVKKDVIEFKNIKRIIDPKGVETAFAYQVALEYALSISLLKFIRTKNEYLVGDDLYRESMGTVYKNNEPFVLVLEKAAKRNHYVGHNTDCLRTEFNSVVKMFCENDELKKVVEQISAIEFNKACEGMPINVGYIRIAPTDSSGPRIQIKYSYTNHMINFITAIFEGRGYSSDENNSRYHDSQRELDVTHGFTKIDFIPLTKISEINLDIMDSENLKEKFSKKISDCETMAKKIFGNSFIDLNNYTLGKYTVVNGQVSYEDAGIVYDTADWNIECTSTGNIRHLWNPVSRDDILNELNNQKKYYTNRGIVVIDRNYERFMTNPEKHVPEFYAVQIYCSEEKKLEKMRGRLSAQETLKNKAKKDYERKLLELDSEQEKIQLDLTQLLTARKEKLS